MLLSTQDSALSTFCGYRTQDSAPSTYFGWSDLCRFKYPWGFTLYPPEDLQFSLSEVTPGWSPGMLIEKLIFSVPYRQAVSRLKRFLEDEISHIFSLASARM